MKRTLCLFASVVLIIFAFAACGEDTNENNTAADDTIKGETTVDNTATEENTEEPSSTESDGSYEETTTSESTESDGLSEEKTTSESTESDTELDGFETNSDGSIDLPMIPLD